MAAERAGAGRRSSLHRVVAIVLALVAVSGCGSSIDGPARTASSSDATESTTTTSVPMSPLGMRLLLVGDSVAYTLRTAGIPTYTRVGCSVTDGVPVMTLDPKFSA